MTESSRSVEVVRIGNGSTETATDRVAVEAALEVRLNGHPFAVIMRTPGADANLVGGFLLSEGVIRSADDVHRLDLSGRRRRAERGPQQKPRGDSPRFARGPPERHPELLLRDVRPAHARVARDRSATACRGMASRHHCPGRASRRFAARNMRSTKPAACTRPGSSISTAACNRAPKMWGATMPSTNCWAERSWPSTPAVALGARRQRPIVVRDRAEGVHRRHSACRRRVGALEPGRRSGAPDRHHAARLRARRSDLPFPRLSAYAIWAYVIGGLVFFSTIFYDLAPRRRLVHVPAAHADGLLARRQRRLLAARHRLHRDLGHRRRRRDRRRHRCAPAARHDAVARCRSSPGRC